MLSARLQIVILLAVVIFLCCPVASRGQESQVQDSAALAAPVEEPPGLAELSSGQVVVTYENAELTIKAHSSPLIEVLHAVCSQIGAELDAPSVADETVLGIIGPGPTREVLTSMLKGSPYDLATAGSVADPDALARVVVFLKTKDSAKDSTKDPTSQDGNDPSLSATAQPVPPPQADFSDPDEVGEKPDMQQMLELLNQAKADVAQVEDGNSGEMSKLLEEVEAQIKAATGAQAGGSSPQSVVPQRGLPGPAVPMMRHSRRR